MQTDRQTDRQTDISPCLQQGTYPLSTWIRVECERHHIHILIQIESTQMNCWIGIGFEGNVIEFGLEPWWKQGYGEEQSRIV